MGFVAIPIPSGEGQNAEEAEAKEAAKAQSVAIPIPSGEGQNKKCWFGPAMWCAVAIPIPSGEGQNPKGIEPLRSSFKKSQYLYLLVKVRTYRSCLDKKTPPKGVVAIPIPSGEGQNSSFICRPSRTLSESQYLYLLVKVRTYLRQYGIHTIPPRGRNTYTFW